MALSHTFSPTTKIASAQVNTNFDEVSDRKVFLCALAEATAGGTSYASGSKKGRFLFAKTDHIESIVAHYLLEAPSTATASVRIYDNDASSEISGSEVSTTSTTPVWLSSGDIKSDFPSIITDLDVQVKSTVGTATLHKAYLEITYK